MNSKNTIVNPILNFRNEDIAETSENSGDGYLLLSGIHEQGHTDAFSYNYSTMMTRSREAVDSSEHSQS